MSARAGPQADHRSKRRTDRRERQPFHEQLLHHAPASAAKRLANGDLLAPCGAARQQQVRQVQARHREDERRHQDQQRGEDRHAAVGLRRGAHRHARHAAKKKRLIVIGAGILGVEASGKAVERLIGGGAGRSRLQYPGGDHRVVAAIGQPGRALLEHLADDAVVAAERKPPLRRHEAHRAGKAARRHADNRERRAVHADGAADECRRETGVAPDPERRDRDRHPRPGPLLVERERTTGRERDAERGEVVRRHDRGKHLPGGVAVADADRGEGVRHQALEHVGAVAQIDVGGIREVAVAVDLDPIAAEEADHLIDAAGTRLEHERVDQGEHRRVRADAEREHADGDRREPGRLPQEAKTVTDVLQQMGHGDSLG